MSEFERYWIRRGYNDAKRGEGFFFHLAAPWSFAPASMLPTYALTGVAVGAYERGRALARGR